LRVSHGELGELVNSRAIDEASKDEEGAVTQVAHHVVVAGQHLLRLVRWVDGEPSVSVWVKLENLRVAVLALKAAVKDD